MDSPQKASTAASTGSDSNNSVPSTAAQKQPVKQVVKRRPRRYKPRTSKVSRCKNGISKIEPEKFSCELPDISSPSKSEIKEKPPEVPPVRRIKYRPVPTNVVRYTVTPSQGRLKVTRSNSTNPLRPKVLKVRNISSPRKSSNQQGTTDGIVRSGPLQTVVTKLAFRNPQDAHFEAASSERRDESDRRIKPEALIRPSGGIQSEPGSPKSHTLQSDVGLPNIWNFPSNKTKDVSNAAFENECFVDNDDDFLDTLLWLHGEKDSHNKDKVNQTDCGDDIEKWLADLTRPQDISCDKRHDVHLGYSLYDEVNTELRVHDGFNAFSDNTYPDTIINNVGILDTEWSFVGEDDTCKNACSNSHVNTFNIETWLNEQKRIITGEACQGDYCSGADSSLTNTEIKDLCNVSENVDEPFYDDLDLSDLGDICYAEVEQDEFPGLFQDSSSPNTTLEAVNTDSWILEQSFDFSNVAQDTASFDNLLALPNSTLCLGDDTSGFTNYRCQITCMPTSSGSFGLLNAELSQRDNAYEIHHDTDSLESKFDDSSDSKFNDSLDSKFDDLLSELCLGKQKQRGADGISPSDNIAALNPTHGYVTDIVNGIHFVSKEGSEGITFQFLQPGVYDDVTDFNYQSEWVFDDTDDPHKSNTEKEDMPDPTTLDEAVQYLIESFGSEGNTDMFLSESGCVSGFVKPQDIPEMLNVPALPTTPCSVDVRDDLGKFSTNKGRGYGDDGEDDDEDDDKDEDNQQSEVGDLESRYLRGRLAIHTRKLSSEDMICRISCIFHEFTMNDDLTYRKSSSQDVDSPMYGTPEDITGTHRYISDDLSCPPVCTDLYRLSAGYWQIDVPVF